MATLTGHHDIDVVIYDLDGVITRKDSFAAFMAQRFRQAPQRLPGALIAVARVLLSSRIGRRRRMAHRVAEIALAGLAEHDYDALAVDFGRRIGCDHQWVRAETVQRIRQQYAMGMRIVIATATERCLAEALLASADIPYDVLSASHLYGTPTGMAVADHRIGERKAQALRELRIPIGEAEFVTDSITDLPTARAAARLILVGASSRTRKRYLRAGLGPVVDGSET